MDDQLRPNLPRIRVAKLDHLREFVASVDMQQRKGDLARKKRLLRKAQHHRGVFADRIQHHWPRKFSSRLTQNVDALRLQRPKMIQSPRRNCRLLSAVGRRCGQFGKRNLRCLRHGPQSKNKRPKTKNPPAVVPAVCQLRSCSKRLRTKLALQSYKTQRPSPSFADENNRQRSLE